MTVINLKSHPGSGRNHEVKSISRICLVSAIIAAATSGWGCSSYIEPVNDSWPSESSPYSRFLYVPANISGASALVAHGSLEDAPAVVRSGYTDPRWERVGETYFSASNNRVLIIPRVLGRPEGRSYTGSEKAREY